MPKLKHNLLGKKSKLDSQGVTGSLVGVVAFGLAATFLSKKLGIDVSKAEVKDTVENARVVAANAAIWIALVGAVVGLWGNWARKAKLAFTAHKGKFAGLSRGFMGNILAAVAGLFAFINAISADWAQLESLIGDGAENWKVISPAVLGIVSTLKGAWGRYRAKESFEGSNLQGLPLVLIGFASLSSCTSIGFEGNQSPEGDARGCFRIIGVGPVDLTICIDKSDPLEAPPLIDDTGSK